MAQSANARLSPDGGLKHEPTNHLRNEHLVDLFFLKSGSRFAVCRDQRALGSVAGMMACTISASLVIIK